MRELKGRNVLFAPVSPTVTNINPALTVLSRLPVSVSKISSWKFVMASEISFEFRIASLARKSVSRLPTYFSSVQPQSEHFVLQFETNI